ncbi:putative membrane protein YhhN [Allocatelliglobosispora scoriae]|uniref:Putative membrane protein YhhN n=1 Tax=Allocatelliglobosispora scoriae TaxID=643052 RepID=A0A841BNX3_9ACTN|nr:lysoplasmalogenase [Allocatelliglobosispora scoriae]MBB5868653.1 putative membrane protein YhhN [Allocatelliglobosispora scoriae]
MPVLIAYAVVAVANLISAGVENDVVFWITKPLLMPLLALWLWRAARGSAVPVRGFTAALAFSTAGDIALLGSGDLWFLAGMVFFLGAHICYITTFVRHGALARLRRWPVLAVPIGVAVLLGAALIWLWPGLAEIGLAVPMTAYGLALATTAATSSAFGWRTGLGGLLFLTSDLLIAVDAAGAAELPGPPIWVMLTYLAAQTLLAFGWLRYQRARTASVL